MHAQIHHVSILNSNHMTTYDFYHRVLGLKLLMKTINQDDHEMIHLFFSDEHNRPGTELTFFEVLIGEQHQFGTNNIERVLLKVPSTASLTYWEERLEKAGILSYGIENFNGRPILRFDAPDQTQIGLVPLGDFEKSELFYPYTGSDIPEEHRILALDAIQLRVQYQEATIKELTQLLNWQKIGQAKFFETEFDVEIMHNDYPDFYQEVHVIADRKNPLANLGIGGIQHVAFGVLDEDELFARSKVLDARSFNNSGILPREFFTSLYFREPNLLLFEIATNAGFLDPSAFAVQIDDITKIPLYLPKFLEPDRVEIEHVLSMQRP
ncbi:VOC family protein [Enterococcus timonensis]|uniref:VOC family protein n=1 Tax=Enterococcus timonensis TaxID=1852364 RepID=UPI0008DAE5FC|nr:VOC family protein [Enterococcus timonensis]